jgi:hypothetical protein
MDGLRIAGFQWVKGDLAVHNREGHMYTSDQASAF